MSNIEYIYGKTKCVMCGTETTLDKTIWSDPELGHICKECLNKKKENKNG